MITLRQLIKQRPINSRFMMGCGTPACVSSSFRIVACGGYNGCGKIEEPEIYIGCGRYMKVYHGCGVDYTSCGSSSCG